MHFERQLVEALERLPSAKWDGTVFRHMFAEIEPDRENVRGARWNPPECPAIYTSLERSTSIAEADYHLSLQPIPVTAKRNIYRIKVALENVIDISRWSTLQQLGLKKEDFDALEYQMSQEIGAVAEWLKHDGMLVPSARTHGLNLVIFPRQQNLATYEFITLDREVLPHPTP